MLGDLDSSDRHSRMLAQAFVMMFLLFGGGTMVLGAWLTYSALPRGREQAASRARRRASVKRSGPHWTVFSTGLFAIGSIYLAVLVVDLVRMLTSDTNSALATPLASALLSYGFQLALAIALMYAGWKSRLRD